MAELVVANRDAASIITASGFNREQVELVKSTVAIGASDMELALFLQVAKHRGLDVFTRQIHFVKRKQKRGDTWIEVGSMQTGIDGFRLIADRTGKYDGQDDAEFEYNESGGLRKATVRVYRKDIARAFVGTAYFAEYAETTRDGGLTRMWKDKPHVMLGKCAESQALRKAFPENLSGLYTDDEMPTIEGEAIVHEDAAKRPATGTVTHINERRQDPPAAATTTSNAEIPPIEADLATLREWLGRRLSIRAKSWTADHMATACAEVASVLGLADDAVTPRTLAEHLPAYRNAVAADGSSSNGGKTAAETPQDVATPSDAQTDAKPTETPSGGNADPKDDAEEQRLAMVAFIDAELRDLPNVTAEQLQERAAQTRQATLDAAPDSPLSITYRWQDLDERELRVFWADIPKRAEVSA